MLLTGSTPDPGGSKPAAAAALAADGQLQSKLVEGASLAMVAVSSRQSLADSQAVLDDVQQVQHRLHAAKADEVGGCSLVLAARLCTAHRRRRRIAPGVTWAASCWNPALPRGCMLKPCMLKPCINCSACQA